ncbi:hypothetical protein AB0D32_03750 [Micromonospora sp. NPDC048170]|uniref:hypothetical protein n=1 Tax=Micromonospora sp. NPDC048170 TaxID=3154819 RepID=UPI0033D38AD1
MISIRPAAPPGLRSMLLGRLTSLFRPQGSDAVVAAGATSDELTWGYVVRREWPDGSHDLFGFDADRERVRWQACRDAGYWLPGSVRPTSWVVVPVNLADVRRHVLGGCWQGSCPNVAGKLVGEGQR